jgi:hypothetical protein
MPGSGHAGIHHAALRAWVLSARRRAKEVDRLGVAGSFIGRVVAHAPVAADRVWPHKAVRDVVNEIDSEAIEGGPLVELMNSRGVTIRAIKVSGHQERDLAARHRRTAGALRNWRLVPDALEALARELDREAGEHDAEADCMIDEA